MRKALEFAVYVHRPDGAIPSLSDGDSRSFLICWRRAMNCTVMRRCSMSPPAAKGFSTSAALERIRRWRLHILRSGWGDGTEAYQDERYLIFDCGPLGAAIAHSIC